MPKSYKSAFDDENLEYVITPESNTLFERARASQANKKRHLVVMSTPPTLDTLDPTVIPPTDVAYVRVKSEGVDQLYYVNPSRKECVLLKGADPALTLKMVDNIIAPEGDILSDKNLSFLKSLTGFNPDLERGQGFAVIGYKKGNKVYIYLVPAFNQGDGKPKTDKNGEPYPYIAESKSARLGSNTGVIHLEAIERLKEQGLIPQDVDEKDLFGAGIFVDKTDALLAEFRNKSANMNELSIAFDREFLLAFYFLPLSWKVSDFEIPEDGNYHEYYMRREIPRAITQKLRACLMTQLSSDEQIKRECSDLTKDAGRSENFPEETWWEENASKPAEKNKKLMQSLYVAAGIHSDTLLIEEIFGVIEKNGLTSGLLDTQYDNETTLIRAAKAGHHRVVEALINAGASVDARDSQGRTALMCAIKRDHRAVVSLLLEAHASVDALDAHQSTPLHYAATRGNISILKKLLAAKPALSDQKNKEGETPLDIAIKNGHTGIVNELLKYTQGSRASPHTLDEKVQEILIKIMMPHPLKTLSEALIGCQKYYREALASHPENKTLLENDYYKHVCDALDDSLRSFDNAPNATAFFTNEQGKTTRKMLQEMRHSLEDFNPGHQASPKSP